MLTLVAEQALDPQGPLGPSRVTIEKGVVARVEKWGGEPPQAGELGGKGFWLLPGWVNAHTHLAMTLLRGAGADHPLDVWLREDVWPVEARMTPRDVYLGSLAGAWEALCAGTTCVADMYFAEGEVARACVEAGLRASLAVGMTGEGDAYARRLEEALEVCHQWHGAAGGRVHMRLGPHAPYTCSPDALALTAQAARQHGLGIHIHLAETLGEVRQLWERYGRGPVEIAAETGLLDPDLPVPTLAAHGVWLTRKDAQRLSSGGAALAHCPLSNLWLGSGMAAAARWARQGLTVAVGTDGPASAPGLDMFSAVRAAWLCSKERAAQGGDPAASAQEVFAWGTVGGGRAVGVPELGRLKPGAPADLVLLRTDRLGFAPVADDPYVAVVGYAGPQDVDTVVVAGRIRVQEGRPVEDLSPLLEEVSARARQLRS